MKKVAIIMLSYGRHDLTAEVLTNNLSNHGYGGRVGLFVVDRKGIAAATNEGLKRAYFSGYDYFCVCGNDIMEPEGWLAARVAVIERLANVGMVAVPLDEVRPALSAEMVIGNWMVSREVLDKVGLMNEAFDPYGAIDLDYNKRCSLSGFNNYYLEGMLAKHIHRHDGKELYGFDKAELVNKTWGLHVAAPEAINIPIIEMEQMYGEG